jgi:hypothetical protein
MEEKEEKKENSLSWLEHIFSFVSELFNTLIAHSDAEIQKIKKKLLHYVVIYGLFTAAVFFILIGLIKYLAEIHFFSSEGIGYIITGSALIVILAAYSLIKKF